MTGNAPAPIRSLNPLTDYPFASQWLAGAPDAQNFLPPPPADWRLALAARDKRPVAPWNADEISELEQFNRAHGNNAGAAIAQLLADPTAVAVVTGQQPNLLASPLYILHKALSARAHAARIARDTGRAVIPIFWIASDDHDFAELRECRFPDEDGGLADIGAVCSRGGAAEGSPAYEWKLADNAERLTVALARLEAGGSKGARVARDILARALSEDPELNFESLFCRTLAQLLGPDQPMLFVVPRLRSLRSRQAAVLRSAIDRHAETAHMISAAGARMDSAGYPPLLAPDASAFPAFYVPDGVRCRVEMRDGRIDAHSRNGGIAKSWSRTEFEHDLEAHAAHFSPNVFTRPLVQDTALPVVAYVGGPGEIAYLAQLRSAYESYGIPAPAALLRTSVTVIDPETAQTLARLGLSAEEISVSAIESRLLERSPETADLLAMVRRIEHAHATEFDHAERIVAERAQKHLKPALEKTRRRLEDACRRLRSRIARQAHGTQWKEAARALATIDPHGAPQERILSPFSLHFGDDPSGLCRFLVSQCDFTNPRHQLALA